MHLKVTVLVLVTAITVSYVETERDVSRSEDIFLSPEQNHIHPTVEKNSSRQNNRSNHRRNNRNKRVKGHGAARRYQHPNDGPNGPGRNPGTGDDNGVVPSSRCRHNYHDSTEQAMNRQINLYLHAGFIYGSMAQHFGQCDVALPGFQKYFNEMAVDQREKYEKLMAYQNLRGGKTVLNIVSAPTASDWGNGLNAMKQALEVEKNINQALLELYRTARLYDDFHATSFVQTSFIVPQVEKIFTISQYISNLERVGPGLGEYLFDKLPQH